MNESSSQTSPKARTYFLPVAVVYGFILTDIILPLSAGMYSFGEIGHSGLYPLWGAMVGLIVGMIVEAVCRPTVRQTQILFCVWLILVLVHFVIAPTLSHAAVLVQRVSIATEQEMGTRPIIDTNTVGREHHPLAIASNPAISVSVRSETGYDDQGRVSKQRTNLRQFTRQDGTSSIDESVVQETSYACDQFKKKRGRI